MDVLRGHYSFDTVHDIGLVCVGKLADRQSVSEGSLEKRARSRARAQLPCQAFGNERAADRTAALIRITCAITKLSEREIDQDKYREVIRGVIWGRCRLDRGDREVT